MTHPVHQYADDVVSGRIVAGQAVRWACARHLADLDRSDLLFDEAAADDLLGFLGLLPHIKGAWAARGETFVPQPWQSFICGSLVGWRRRDTGLRRFREGYLRVAKKQGKSFMGAGFGHYFLLGSEEEGAEIWCAATKEEQARVLWDVAAAMVDKAPWMRGIVRRSAKRLYVPASNSFWGFVGRDSTSESYDGINPLLVLCDEIHAWKSGRLWQMLERGMIARQQPLLLAMTTAGIDLTGFGYRADQKYLKMIDPASGVTSDQSFVYIAALDDGDDWRSPAVWIKANPNLGVTVTADNLRLAVEKAGLDGEEERNVRTKLLNQWLAGGARYLAVEEWDACPRGPGPERWLEHCREELRGRICHVGLDLSSSVDMTAAIFVFPPLDLDDEAEPWHVVALFWLPEEGIDRRERRDGLPYREWVERGYLRLSPGRLIQLAQVRREVLELAAGFRVKSWVYDPFFAQEFSQRLEDEGYLVVECRQSFRNLSEPTKLVRDLVLQHRLAHGGHPILRGHAQNLEVQRQAENPRAVRPVKGETGRQIDGIVALIMGVYGTLFEDEDDERSIYEEFGILERFDE